MMVSRPVTTARGAGFVGFGLMSEADERHQDVESGGTSQERVPNIDMVCSAYVLKRGDEMELAI